MNDQVTISRTTLERIIKNLEDAVDVCYNVDSDDGWNYEKTYPFATGYSKSAMSNTAQELKSYLNN